MSSVPNLIVGLKIYANGKLLPTSFKEYVHHWSNQIRRSVHTNVKQVDRKFEVNLIQSSFFTRNKQLSYREEVYTLSMLTSLREKYPDAKNVTVEKHNEQWYQNKINGNRGSVMSCRSRLTFLKRAFGELNKTFLDEFKKC